MDFDTAKENIQPLKGGRRADRLETVLGGEKDLLENERKEYEEAIESYNGPDPLDTWYSYICWIEQSYPKSGNESGLHEAVSKCILKFESDMRYRQDRRLIKLFIKYIDLQDNPHELYEQLYVSGIGTMVADLYIAWSYYYDAVNDFKKAESIFQKGFSASAQPYEELTQAHQAFTISVTQRMLYDDDMSKKRFQASLDEKRNALTSLKTYNKKFVGSVRVGNAIKNELPGRVPVNENVEIGQQRVNVHKDEADPMDFPTTSGVKSIFDISKKTENLHEVGPWTKAGKSSKHNKLFDAKSIESSHPGFAIMEDESLPPISYKNKLYEKGIILLPNWVAKNKPQTPWNVPIIIDEPTVPKTIPCYDKFMLYPSSDIEISPEEWKAYKWFKLRGMSAPVVEQNASIFENTFEGGPRIYPGFVRKNVKQEVVQFKLDYDVNDSRFQFPIKDMISSDFSTEYSQDELLAAKFRRGEIKLVSNDDFEESLIDDNMDMTVIGDRRQSVYCLSRKSFVPRKSILRKSVMQPIIEDDQHKSDTVAAKSENRVRFEEPIVEEEPEQNVEEKKNVLKRKLEIDSDVKEIPKGRDSSPESKRLSAEFVSDFFKAPPPPKPTLKPNFEIFEEETNETFSTQNFNFFIKSQSVSTPISKKTVPRLVPLSVEPQQSLDTQKFEVHEIVEHTIPSNNLHKQLSTIAEVTESSNSTKSSVSQISGETEIDSHIKHTVPTVSKLSPCHEGKDWDDCSKNPLNVFRIPEDQTETTPFIKSFMLPKLKDLQIPPTPMKAPTMSFLEEKLVPLSLSFVPFLDDSVKFVPPKPKSPIISNIIKEKIDSPEQSILEIPKLSETISNVCKLPENVQGNGKIENVDHVEIPATQNLSEIEIPATQNLSDIEIPATQDMSMNQNDESLKIPELRNDDDHCEIPATQEVPAYPQIHLDDEEIPETQDLMIPNIQDLSIKDTDHLEIPATQEFVEQQNNLIHISGIQEKSTQSVVPCKVAFSVYEDSVCEVVPQQKVIATFPPVLSNQSDMANMSRKENLILPNIKALERTSSDEFLAMCIKSPEKYKPKSEISDLLKFSDAKSKLSLLEGSFNELQINRPQKSPSPTMNIIEADLNTEKFNLPLNFGKNSTIIGDVFKVPPKMPERKPSLDLSIEMNEEESERLGKSKTSSDKKDESVFKVPILLPQVPVKVAENKKEDFAIFEDEEDDDLSKSIYHHNKQEQLFEQQDNIDTWEDEKFCSFIADDQNRYEYTIIQQHDESISFKLRNAIVRSNGNPFSSEVRNLILEQCNFEQYLEDHIDTCTLVKNVPKLKLGGTLQCTNEVYSVSKLLGKGGFGAVYEVRNLKTSKSYAAKQEKPPNMWEYYILIELMSRLSSKNVVHMFPAYMHVKNAFVGNNASILISEFSPFGSIIDVCNKIRAYTGRNVDEYIGMIFASQLLSIVDYLHSCHIIHADIKPDNFVLMSKIEIGMKVPALQLIDFGSAIDMESFSKNDVFTYVVKTDNFTCCEMLDNKPWTYQTDLYGLCGTTHVILFGKYMEVEKKLINWQVKTRFPRYFQKDVWDIFFNTLLNVPDCKTMPNLQHLKQELDEEIAFKQKYILDKVAEFNKALLS